MVLARGGPPHSYTSPNIDDDEDQDGDDHAWMMVMMMVMMIINQVNQANYYISSVAKVTSSKVFNRYIRLPGPHR